jgi:hypothetical protein
MARVARACALAGAGDVAGAEDEFRVALSAATALLDGGQADDAEPVFRRAWEAGIAAAAPGLALCLRARGAALEARALVAAALVSVVDPLVRELLIEIAAPEETIMVQGLRLDETGDRLALACGRCGRAWEESLPSWMCSLPVACAGCGAAGYLEPEALATAAARLDPPLPVPVADALDAGVARLVAHWHEVPVLAAGLAQGGVDVGAAAAHALFPVVLDATVAAYRETS